MTFSFSNPKIVDSKPNLHEPPSKIATFWPKFFSTCAGSVGLIDWKVFALGAANGKSKACNKLKVSAWFGTLIPTVFFPPVIKSETVGFFFQN